MNQTLAVKYRPRTFEEVCGQSITVQILEKAVEARKFKNCYLFAGDSGCGKTTLARIFANKINNGIGEPIEIDAASNNGVAGAVMGAGMGFGMGFGMGGTINDQMQLAMAEQRKCPSCGERMGTMQRFCPACGCNTEEQKKAVSAKCSACGKELA
jgi:DNA polymerase III delta prime subunit